MSESDIPRTQFICKHLNNKEIALIVKNLQLYSILFSDMQ